MQVVNEEEATARHLWLDWFEKSDGYPYYYDGCYEHCFFCGESIEGDHDEKCVYVRACQEFAKKCR